jgi:hypothetical protein
LYKLFSGLNFKGGTIRFKKCSRGKTKNLYFNQAVIKAFKQRAKM